MTNPMIQAALISEHKHAMQRVEEEARRQREAHLVLPSQAHQPQSEQCAPMHSAAKLAVAVRR